MRAALLAEQEACAHDGNDRAGIQRLAHTWLVNDATGREHRDLHRSSHETREVIMLTILLIIIVILLLTGGGFGYRRRGRRL